MLTHQFTFQKEQFCQEYIMDFNGTQAAARAGYSKKSARQTAASLLAQPDVKDRIEELIRQRSARTRITPDLVLLELWSIATDDIKNYLSFAPRKVTATDPETGAEIEKDMHVSITVKDSASVNTRNIAEMSVNKDGLFKFRLCSRENALLMVAKHLGMFAEKAAPAAPVRPFTGTVPIINILPPPDYTVETNVTN